MNGALQAAIAWYGNIQRWHGVKNVIREERPDRRKGLANGIRLIAEVHAEECLPRDAQCQAHHLYRDIQRLIVLGSSAPSFKHGHCCARHQCAKLGKSLAMESWLHQTTLVKPGISIV